MKVSVIQENLTKALSVVSRIVGARTALPILSNIMLSTEDARLKLSATNLELGMIYYIGCKVEEEGSITLPAKLLTELVAGLSNDKIQLSSSDTNLTINTTNFNSTINGISSDEFPAIPTIKTKPNLSLDSQDFLGLLNEVSVAASIDEARPVLAGVLCSIHGSELTLVATDSYRLAEVSQSIDKTKDIQIIIPIRTIQELTRILANIEGDLQVYINSTEIMFEIGDIQLISRLIDGKYPDYKQIIPQNNTSEALLDRQELHHYVKLANIFARENANTIKLAFQKDQLTISSSASQVGENESTLPIKLTGEEGEISLNARFLQEALASMKTPKVTLSISGKLNPCMITPQQTSKSPTQLVHIIMPLKS